MRFQQFMNSSSLMGLYKDYHQFFKELQKELKKNGVNLNESLILLALFFEGSKKVTPSNLSQSLYLTKDSVSHSLKSLVQKNYIEKELLMSDSRKTSLHLTIIGKKISTDLIKTFDSLEAKYEMTKQNHSRV